MSGPVHAILIGAGQRGAEAYDPCALHHPDQFRFAALAPLKQGPYGRCVYPCDNNGFVYQVVRMCRLT